MHTPPKQLTMVRRVPTETRWRIINMCKAEIPQKEIAAKVGCSVATVNRIIQAFRNEGRIKDAPRGAPARSTSLQEDLLIVAASVDDPFLTAADIKRELGLVSSTATIRRRLKECGARCRVAHQEPSFLDEHSAARLQFAREHLNWGAEEWANIIFSQEATFCARWKLSRHVWRPPRSR